MFLKYPSPQRGALAALYAGLVLTAAVTVAAYLERSAIADHVREGYPGYGSGRVDDAVTAWLAILTVVGVLGAAGWLSTARLVGAGRAGARWVALTLFAAGTSVALAAAVTKDTSGEVGLAPQVGWLGLLPCVAGLVAVVQLWARRPAR
jgi:hypothetical protein